MDPTGHLSIRGHLNKDHISPCLSPQYLATNLLVSSWDSHHFLLLSLTLDPFSGLLFTGPPGSQLHHIISQGGTESSSQSLG